MLDERNRPAKIKNDDEVKEVSYAAKPRSQLLLHIQYIIHFQLHSIMI